MRKMEAVSFGMPRKLGIEYPGARYHIISSGNYRKDLFVQRGSGEAFERTIFEAALRCGWELFAYVIMSNHYHLALRTPEPNLVVGMKWLQITFATRFNCFHRERGHVFQGRYKSLLVAEEMKKSGKSEPDIAGGRKSATWKVTAAKRLRRETTAGNPWIARRLRMGSRNYVSNLIHT